MTIFLKAISVILIMSLLFSCSGAATVQNSWSQSELEQIIDTWRVQAGIPGMVVGISLPDRPEILVTSGSSNVTDRVLIKKDDQFRIASITKTFIAAEVLRLATNGKIQLDQSLNTYLSGIPHGDVVTIRHLLSHRSGYFDAVHDDPKFIPYVAEHLDWQWKWDELLALAFQHELYFQPGSDYKYSNTNYILLARVIEKVTGRALDDTLTFDLIIPLHLDHTVYETTQTQISPNELVHGYITHPLTGKTLDSTTIPYSTVVSLSADTMISNASDLLNWSRALYAKDASTLDPSFKKQMLTFDDISNYGLGAFQFKTPIGISLGHGGDTAGYLSLMEYFPKQDMSMVILANADAPSINLSALRDLLLATLYKDELENGVTKLIADLKSQDASVRKDAIIALGHSGSNMEEAIQLLAGALREDSSAENRKEAALALGLVGKDSTQAIQALTEALKDDDKSVQEAAQLALSILK